MKLNLRELFKSLFAILGVPLERLAISRDQGLSTRGTAAFTYEQMAEDVYAVLRQLGIHLP